MRKSLQQIWDEMPLKSDKGDIHSYLGVYEKLFAPYRDAEINVLEIGLFNGSSLLLWEQYFTKAAVHGIDCSETPVDGMADLRPLIAEGTHNIHIMDGSCEGQIEIEFGETKWDIVIDDSNHVLETQLKTIEIFKSRLAPNGLILIEDVQNLDTERAVFEALSDELDIEIIDLRHVKGRYDDTIIIVKNKP